MNEVYPERGRIHNWGTFPSQGADGITADATMRITPAVDHFQLCKVTCEIFLNRKLKSLDKDDPVAVNIRRFMEGDFRYKIFKHASEAVLPYVKFDEGGVNVIDEALRREDLVTVFTNSTTEKAVRALQNSGFGSRVVDGRI
ncbi:hypothetical protein HZC20_00650 [Candidatus Peregrinibacteria bacterium]|nr:hypothetical protein [Candidatus Peregrinibacteria bacterium]